MCVYGSFPIAAPDDLTAGMRVRATHTHTYAHTHTHTHTHTHMAASLLPRPTTLRRAHTHTHTHARTHTHTHTHVRPHTHMRLHTHVRTHAHTWQLPYCLAGRLCGGEANSQPSRHGREPPYHLRPCSRYQAGHQHVIYMCRITSLGLFCHEYRSLLTIICGLARATKQDINT